MPLQYKRLGENNQTSPVGSRADISFSFLKENLRSKVIIELWKTQAGRDVPNASHPSVCSEAG